MKIKTDKSKSQKWKKRLGILLLALSLAGLGLFLSPFVAVKQEQKQRQSFGYLLAKKTDNTSQVVINQPFTPAKEEKITVKSFYLTIESIGLHSAPVVPQIEADNKAGYKKALNQGLVHAQGTALPGQDDFVYIFGHSAFYPDFIVRSQAWLYKLNKVRVDDRIKLEFNGQHYLYYVFDKKIVRINDLQIIRKYKGKDVLVLQTCYPPGTALYSLLLFAKPSKMGALIY